MGLQDLLYQIDNHIQNNDKHAQTRVLKEILNNRNKLYKECLDNNLHDKYSEVLYKILLLELDEEEDESIETAEYAYICLYKLIVDTQSRDIYKRRILLLHYFADYFTDSIIEIFLKKYKKDNILQARNLALECIEKMQIVDLLHLDANHKEYLDNEDLLVDVSNQIETDANLSEQEYKDYELMHRILANYLYHKYNKL